ncbi:MAG: RNase adapter RapZ [Gammaproteobacteria bacterium]|nr:RNase adapter RapZ [Gammaproteobacteria bacterium]
MKLIIISGLSGSGKTVALHTLEDEGYYCVDNLTLSLLPSFIDQIVEHEFKAYDLVAIGIDARSGSQNLDSFSDIIKSIKSTAIDIEVVFFQAEKNTLIKRFSDTRRKHPLTRKGAPLGEAIDIETSLLQPISTAADLNIDTTNTNIHQLREQIKQRILNRPKNELSLLIQSFGFKNSVPTDSDFVFDVRCLPNPHWEESLRPLSGQDPEVQHFLHDKPDVIAMLDQISQFMEYWIPKFAEQNRYYLTISVGCTGGQHRSVYMADQLLKRLQNHYSNVSLRHREME